MKIGDVVIVKLPNSEEMTATITGFQQESWPILKFSNGFEYPLHCSFIKSN